MGILIFLKIRKEIKKRNGINAGLGVYRRGDRLSRAVSGDIGRPVRLGTMFTNPLFVRV